MARVTHARWSRPPASGDGAATLGGDLLDKDLYACSSNWVITLVYSPSIIQCVTDADGCTAYTATRTRVLLNYMEDGAYRRSQWPC